MHYLAKQRWFSKAMLNHQRVQLPADVRWIYLYVIHMQIISYIYIYVKQCKCKSKCKYSCVVY